MPQAKKAAILLIHCPDTRGIVRAVTDFLLEHNGNILRLDQHTDTQQKRFYMRVSWDLERFDIEPELIGQSFHRRVGDAYEMNWTLHFSSKTPRMAIFVSRQAHCFHDVLARFECGEWNVEIPLVISNHDFLRPIAERIGINFYHLPVTKENKAEVEQKELELLQQHQIDIIVLARYMQILSDRFISNYRNRIINIHHSFLPAFAGARPYHAAFARGVKIIGATSHYVTGELDGGPIIEQDVVRVNHEHNVEDLIRKGRDLEKIVLARAIWQHLNHNILVCDNRTFVFD